MSSFAGIPPYPLMVSEQSLALCLEDFPFEHGDTPEIVLLGAEAIKAENSFLDGYVRGYLDSLVSMAQMHLGEDAGKWVRSGVLVGAHATYFALSKSREQPLPQVHPCVLDLVNCSEELCFEFDGHNDGAGEYQDPLMIRLVDALHDLPDEEVGEFGELYSES